MRGTGLRIVFRQAYLDVLAIGVVMVVSALLLGGCGGTAPSPTPVPAKPAAVAPTKAAEPAKPTEVPKAQPAPTKAAAPTPAPAKKVAFPEAGKVITMNIPWQAGGINDVTARHLAPILEKEVGATIQVVNRAGASSQIGLTELVRSKPDGYTVGLITLPSALTTYLEPERKAIYERKSFQPVALHVLDPGTIVVKANSPFKTTKDLVDAAKANPEKVKVGDVGILTGKHISILQLQQLTGCKFAVVHFPGGPDARAAVLGGHIDAEFATAGEVVAQVKAGELRILGIMDNEPSKYYPDVKTMEAQGYKLYSSSSRGWVLTAGTPKEIVDVWSAAFKKAINNEEHTKKLDEMGAPLRYMDPAAFEKYWADMEQEVKTLMPLAKES